MYLFRVCVTVATALICFWLIVKIFGCAHEDQPTEDNLTLAQAQLKRDSYLSQLQYAQDQYGFVATRCDSATFTSLLLAAAPGIDIDIHQVEKEPGKWVRHPEPCWSVGESKSETSLDVYLGVSHMLLTLGNAKAKEDLQEIIARGERLSWVMGDGSAEFANIAGLSPLLYDLENHLNSAVSVFSGPIPPLQGHRGHIAALYVHLAGRMDGSIDEISFQMLSHLAKSSPSNPLFQALYHNYSDGDQSAAISLVVAEPEAIPLEVGAHSWGSAPRWLFTVLAVAIIEGVM